MSWRDQFGTGAILESTDGATYNVKEIEDPKAKQEEEIQLNVPSLAEQLTARKAEEEEEYRQMHRNLPPKALDEEEAFFLEAIQREEQIKEDLKRKQEQKDIDSFKNEIANRVIKMNDDQNGNNNIIKPINVQIHSNNNHDNKSKELIIAPSVHQNSDKPKVNLDGIVLLKRVKKKKKKKTKNKKKKDKKRKLEDIDNNNNADSNNAKRRKLDLEQEGNDNKLSEWERE